MKLLMPKRSIRGFTIVELLVVIAIIGILMSISIVIYTTVQAQSRDSARSSDVTILKHALENYYQDHGEYPQVCPGAANGYACNVSYLASALQPYLDSVPHDPTNSGTSNDYQYVRNKDSSSGQAFALYIHYETKPACKTGSYLISKNLNWWGTAVPLCTD